MSNDLVRALEGALQKDRVLTKASELLCYAYDATAGEAGRVPDVVVLPASTDEVARVVRIARDAGAPVYPPWRTSSSFWPPPTEEQQHDHPHVHSHAEAGQPGFIEARTLRDTRSGRLVGMARWEDEASWRAGVEAMRAAVADDAFDEWEDGDTEGGAALPVVPLGHGLR